MNSEVSQKLVQYLSTLEGAVKTGSDFVVEQAPLVLQELLLRERVLNSVGMSFSALLIVACLCCLRKCINLINNLGEDAFIFMNGMAVLAFGLIGLGFAIDNFFRFVTCWFAPRVFILEQIKNYL